MKNKTVLIALLYCFLSIASKLILFYGKFYDSPAGRLVPFGMLGMILPFALWATYLKRKENNGIIGGKDAIRVSLMMVSIIAIIMLAFDYIFFELEMKAFYQHFFANTDYNALMAEKLKHEKNVKMFDIVKQQLMYESGFTHFSISRAVFPIFAFGLFSSFLSGVFMKRA